MSDRREQIENEITALKMLLSDTDYQVTKYAEGLTACSTQKEENAFREAFMAQYGDVIASRVQWRQRINELEEEREALPPDPEPEIEETPIIEEEDTGAETGTLNIVTEEEDENPPEIVHDTEEEETEIDDGEPEIVHDDEEEDEEPEAETETEQDPAPEE